MSDDCQTQKGQDLIWDYFQNESPESFEGSRVRIQLLVKLIGSPSSVLNIGCGTGLFERSALQRGLEVYSLDPSERSIKKLRDSLGLDDRAKVGYIQAIPFPNATFDVVVVSEVLEHLAPDIVKAGLAEIHRVLKPGGRILGTVPSRENLKEQMVVCPCCKKRFHRWGHEQSFDPPKMEGLLDDYFGAVRLTERPIIPWGILNWKGKVGGTVKLLLWKLGVQGSNENLIFEAMKTETKTTTA
jgi:SAM-dependent methyltransferase